VAADSVVDDRQATGIKLGNQVAMFFFFWHHFRN